MLAQALHLGLIGRILAEAEVHEVADERDGIGDASSLDFEVAEAHIIESLELGVTERQDVDFLIAEHAGDIAASVLHHQLLELAVICSDVVE